MNVSTDQLRVTSVPYSGRNNVIFTGIPLKRDSFKVNSGKYFITVKIKTSELPITPVVGQHWTIKGICIVENVEIHNYIMQRHTYESPEEIICLLPEDGEQIIRFLAKERDFEGIGESKARRLWELLGEDFYHVLDNDSPESRTLLRSVLNDKSIDALFIGYGKYRNLSACNWMSKHKITAEVQQRLLKYHDQDSIKAIEKNPYLLIGFGMDFNDVDILARDKFFVNESDTRRLSATVEIAIRKEILEGHTYTTKAAITPAVKKLLGTYELAKQALTIGHKKTQFVLNAEKRTYHPTAQLIMELAVEKRLKTLVGKKDLYDNKAQIAYNSAVNELPYELTKKQHKAIVTTLNNGISCITGGAGTGKTTVLRTALKAFSQMGYQIHAVALSGRAAMRLHESIGFKTLTIAAFLRQEPIEPSINEPKHLLVIDEASMIDLPTMYRLVTHMSPKVRIVFTGDPDQLPPIGCGRVLADIVESGSIANTVLDIVKRQEGTTGIPEYSKLINKGIVPDILSTGNITFHETPKHLIAECCTDLFSEATDNSRIIAATKSMVANINTLTQSIVNTDSKRLEFNMNNEKNYCNLFLNDTILFTKNNYDKGIQNGTLGKLVSVETAGDIYGKVELDTGDIVEITESLLDCMELGYCITLHKAQGSQFPRVIIALQKSIIVDRAWLYTAVTRAETEVHIVGSIKDFKDIIRSTSHTYRRNSYLKDLLIKRINRIRFVQ